jgi:hypothetical protein
MKHHYKDIRDKIKQRPKWFDECGVPRYCTFHPDETNDIYADEAVLFIIKCQSCKEVFKVCLSRSITSSCSLYKQIKDHRLHYGDPPNIGCCPAGATMNSEAVQILEYWNKVDFKWNRVKEFTGKYL